MWWVMMQCLHVNSGNLMYRCIFSSTHSSHNYLHFSAVLINNLSCTDITCSNWPIQFWIFFLEEAPLSKQSWKLWILVCPIQQRNDPASGCNILSSFLKCSRLFLTFIKSWCILHTLVEYIRSSSVDKRPTRGAFLLYMSVKVRFCRNGVPIRKI